MPIEEFHARSESDVVTFDKVQMAFSSSLVKKHKLMDYDYVRVGVDPEFRRVYLSFQKEGGPGTLKFFQQTGRSNRKMFAVGGLYAKYDWIRVLKTERDQSKKQFVLEEVLPDQVDIYPIYRFFVTIGYAWAVERSFNDDRNYPAEPGVYRLKYRGEIIRIGESGSIRDRLQTHFRDYSTEVDAYDFEVVPDPQERKEEEKRLLNAFRASVGRLPKLNPQAH
jgi:hypothetical protein